MLASYEGGPSMDPEIKRLRDAFAESRRPVAGVRHRCPADLREQIVSQARALRRQGLSLRAIASRFAMSPKTLANWLQRYPGTLRPVTIASSCAMAPRPSDGIKIVTPQGYRIEGLGVDEVVALVKALM
jgi:lambda repressor-like predicted transcriptional regulator